MSDLSFDEEAAVQRLMRLLSVPGITGEEGAIAREVSHGAQGHRRAGAANTH